MKYPYEIEKANNEKYSQHFVANLINTISKNNIFYWISKSLYIQTQLKLPLQQKNDLKWNENLNLNLELNTSLNVASLLFLLKYNKTS